MSSRFSGVVALAFALALVACEFAVPAPPTRPPVPDGWTITTGMDGDLRLALPPWIVPFDPRNGLFANEFPDPDTNEFLQLMAQGPRNALPQPVAGELLERWLEAHIESAGPGRGTTSRIDLPSGSGVLIERVVSFGFASDWRFAAYAIATPSGVAYLLIDGPASRWGGREDDLRLIPMLIEVGAGR